MIGRVFAQEDVLFFTRWLRSPLTTGSVRPSGRDLARVMASTLHGVHDGCVVELGGGTGAVTEALLATGHPRERLIVVERDPALYSWLKRRFPGVLVICGDASHLCRYLVDHRIEAPARVISSLPLLALPKTQRELIVRESFAALAPDGEFVQYSYSPACPIPAATLAEHSLTARLVGTAWRNLPPARVWRISRQRAD